MRGGRPTRTRSATCSTSSGSSSASHPCHQVRCREGPVSDVLRGPPESRRRAGRPGLWEARAADGASGRPGQGPARRYRGIAGPVEPGTWCEEGRTRGRACGGLPGQCHDPRRAGCHVDGDGPAVDVDPLRGGPSGGGPGRGDGPAAETDRRRVGRGQSCRVVAAQRDPASRPVRRRQVQRHPVGRAGRCGRVLDVDQDGGQLAMATGGGVRAEPPEIAVCHVEVEEPAAGRELPEGPDPVVQRRCRQPAGGQLVGIRGAERAVVPVRDRVVR